MVCSIHIAMRLTLAFLTAFSVSVLANPVPFDPQILIDTGGDSLPISSNIGIAQPCSPGPCTFDFFNDTGAILTSFTFATTINKGLSETAINSFTCADPHGFFLDCTIQYESSSGLLKYLFSGVVPADGDETTDTDVGEHEGIPLAGPPPQGHFIITFTGWQQDLTVGTEQLYSGVPVTQNSFETSAVPEPSYRAAAACLGFALLAAWRWRRRSILPQ